MNYLRSKDLALALLEAQMSHKSSVTYMNTKAPSVINSNLHCHLLKMIFIKTVGRSGKKIH